MPIYLPHHLSSMVNKRQRLNSALHLLLATTLILKGADKFAHHNILGGLMLLFGIIVFAYFIYTVLKKKENKTMHILILLFEALVSLFIAYIFFEDGKKYVQYGFILAAIGFLISTFVVIRQKDH